MTTLLRPRHGAGGQVDARDFALDCCALEHRLLFSAAPIDPTLLGSTESGEPLLNLQSGDLAAEHEFRVGSALATDWDPISNGLLMNAPLVPGLENWGELDEMELETFLIYDSIRLPSEVPLGPLFLPENIDTSGGVHVGLLAGIDADTGEKLVYEIAGGGDADHFQIAGPMRNVIVFGDGILDAESRSAYEVQLRVTDSLGHQRTEVFTVHIADDTSEFAISEIYDADASLNEILENAPTGTPTGITIHAWDGDLTDNVRYDLLNDADGRFTIDPSTGMVFVANGSLLDREVDASHTILVQVASDDGTTLSEEIVVNVLDVNDNPLTFATSTRVTLDEHSMLAVTVTAIDIDSPKELIIYSIAGGTDASKFAINPTTGDLRFVSMPDFEAPHDTDANNVYTVEISANDAHGVTAIQSFDVTITDRNDPPVAEDDSLAATQETALMISTETLIGNDTDGDGDRLTVQLVDGPVSGRLILNADGTISYQPEPGFLGTDRFTYYATDGDGNSNVATVEIQVRADPTSSRNEATTARRPAPTTPQPSTQDSIDEPQEQATPLPLHGWEEHLGDAQQYLRKRISAVIELIRQATEEDAVIRVDEIRDQRETHHFEPMLTRSAPRVINAVSSDRYRPSTAELLDQLNVRAFDNQLDLMIDTMSGSDMPDFAVAGATMTTAAMSIGYVVWTTRASYMMASLVAAAPAWKQIDPLPILEFTEVLGDTDEADDRSDINRLLQDPGKIFRKQVPLAEDTPSPSQDVRL